MIAAIRLGAYGAGLAVLFGGTFVAADAVVPESTVSNWTNEARGHDMSTSRTGTDHGGTSHGGHGTHADAASSSTDAVVPGVTSAQAGYLLSPVAAPAAVGEAGELTFRILDSDGEAVTEFTTSHEKDLHLIVVRTDGTQFRHVHPTMAADGTWSLPWEWAAAGTYRVYADFVPFGDDAGTLTLTRTVDVAGNFTPAPPAPTTTASVDGFDVKVDGDLVAGSSSELTFTVSKDGQPVTTLQPYLGAFGHLVALREGDLAYLHVHPDGEDPAAGSNSGPEVGFMAEAPTPGRYLLYLDFQVDDKVHSAPFVLDTGRTTGRSAPGTTRDRHAETQADDADTVSGTGSGDGHDH